MPQQPAICANAAGPSSDWAPEIKACETDDDCSFVATGSCCGPGIIYGIAVAALDDYRACFEFVPPPGGCPPLGCASFASTEDQQAPNDASSVLARCFDVDGKKQCMTTVKGSCEQNATRCAAGETCTNGCGQPCHCEGGFMVCDRPADGSPCSGPGQYCSYRPTPDASSYINCSCNATSSTWVCPPG